MAPLHRAVASRRCIADRMRYRQRVNLNVQEETAARTSSAEPTHWVLLLHGLLGRGQNLRTLARDLLAVSLDGEAPCQASGAQDHAEGSDSPLGSTRGTPVHLGHPTLGVLLIDLPFHGRSGDGSAKCPEDASVKRCGADVLEALTRWHQEKVQGVKPGAAVAGDLGNGKAAAAAPKLVAIVGHSLGAKVALSLAHELWTQKEAEGLGAHLRLLGLLDSPVGPTPLGSREAGPVLEALQQMSMPVDSIAVFKEALHAAGLPTSVASWLAGNLRASSALRSSGDKLTGDKTKDAGAGYVWAPGSDGRDQHPDDAFRRTLRALQALIDDYCRVDLSAELRASSALGQVMVALGERSQAVDMAERTKLAAHASVQVLPEAGHWVHVDARAALGTWIGEALQRHVLGHALGC